MFELGDIVRAKKDLDSGCEYRTSKGAVGVVVQSRKGNRLAVKSHAWFWRLNTDLWEPTK